jgi:NADH-quinone oxidoreductase subunit H
MEIDVALIIEWIVKSAILVVILLLGFAYTTWYERRLVAFFQARIGPNRAGPFGLLQPVADGIKLIFKEELIPEKADKLMFLVAPVITVIPALIILGVVPFGDAIFLFGREIKLYISDVNIGVLYILAVASISVYGIVLAGWASNNKYALMGGLRSSAQMISYELALGLAFVGPILAAGSMSLMDIVNAQKGLWFIVTQPLGAFICYFAMMAEVNRDPFDMPEAEQELVAGYHVEYSGMKFALFFMGEYVKMAAVSVIFASLFLGGYRGPFIDSVPILGPIYMFIKVVLSLGVMIWLRATLPRFRYDRVMHYGWKVLLPLSLLNLFIIAVLMIIGVL